MTKPIGTMTIKTIISKLRDAQSYSKIVRDLSVSKGYISKVMTALRENTINFDDALQMEEEPRKG